MDPSQTPPPTGTSQVNNTTVLDDGNHSYWPVILEWLNSPEPRPPRPIVQCIVCADHLRIQDIPPTGREREDGAIINPCQHICGADCLAAWISSPQVRNRPTCPVCRGTIHVLTTDITSRIPEESSYWQARVPVVGPATGAGTTMRTQLTQAGLWPPTPENRMRRAQLRNRRARYIEVEERRAERRHARWRARGHPVSEDAEERVRIMIGVRADELEGRAQEREAGVPSQLETLTAGLARHRNTPETRVDSVEITRIIETAEDDEAELDRYIQGWEDSEEGE